MLSQSGGFYVVPPALNGDLGGVRTPAATIGASQLPDGASSASNRQTHSTGVK